MNIQKNNQDNKEIEIMVEISWEEMKAHLDHAAAKISEQVKVEGFRPGKVPYDVLKKQVDEMQILQEAANFAVRATADKVLQDELKDLQAIGQPRVAVTKMVPCSPLEYKITISLMPEIKLGDYKNLKIKSVEEKVEEEEIEKVLKDLQNMRAKEVIVDREIKNSDKVIVNIQMFLDKVPIEGGQSKGTAIIIGADYIIPGFDKELIGAKKGDVREFILPYSKDHYQKNLAGKRVDFKVDVAEIYERAIPELNEEFAKSLGGRNLEELKKQIKENLSKEKEQRAEQKTVMEIFEKILSKTTFSHLPETMIESEVHNMIHELKHGVEQQGGQFDDYLVHIKKTGSDLEKDFHSDAEKRVKTSLMISQIVKIEDIKIEDKEIQEAVNRQLAAYDNNQELKKKADTPDFRNYIHYNLINQKAIKKLKEWNAVN